MTTLTWIPEYSVGNEILDGQHKRLLALCARALSCLERTDEGAAEETRAILRELGDYAREHFATEERMLEACGYEKLGAHREDHASYAAQLDEFLARAATESIDAAMLCLCVTDWWSRHILEADRRYRECIVGGAA